MHPSGGSNLYERQQQQYYSRQSPYGQNVDIYNCLYAEAHRKLLQARPLQSVSTEGSSRQAESAIFPHGGYSRVINRNNERGQGLTRRLNRKAKELRRKLLRDKEIETQRKRIARKREKERYKETKGVSKKQLEQQTPLRIEASSSHRPRSPAVEKGRDYVCKVNSSLLNVERNYMSIKERYPKLFTSPDCSKVIVNWPRENLKIPLDVPVSFRHIYVHDVMESRQKVVSITNNPANLENGTTRWNAKIILMSGLDMEELVSERDSEDGIPHVCNMIKFACLKHGNTLKAIGGLYEAIDGNDTSLHKSTLVQTALRYAKDLIGLDLKNCQHWNPFLEIHYDRVSHKEVTVLYVPDLSNSLPSQDAWDKWLAFKKDAKDKSGEKLKATVINEDDGGEEVSRHPGLFLQTKDSNKFRSSSLSLDSLLDYDDNHIEESTFELLLFAETFYEVLQYQEGSEILAFLRKLRIFMARRNHKMRQSKEAFEKEKMKISNKYFKTDDSEVKINSVENKILEDEVENTKSDEDVEEDVEDVSDASPGNDKVGIDVKSKNTVNNEAEKVDIKQEEYIDNRLLLAFRFFDRNRVGHIRVEDMRLIIHNLGFCLSDGEVKELVQCAMLESNTLNDDRILYNKLVRMSDIGN